MAYDGNDKVLEEVTGKSYEFGFTTDIESDKAPAGLNEDIIRLISSKKEEPEWLLKWRPRRLCRLAKNGGARLAPPPIPKTGLPSDQLLFSAQAKKAA
jgi:hypothetical protein